MGIEVAQGFSGIAFVAGSPLLGLGFSGRRCWAPGK